MAVPVQTPFIEYVANGVTTNFSLGFDCENQSHLIVTVDDIEPITGSWSLLVGAVVFNSAPITGSKIIIKRNSPFERDRDFQLYDQSFRPPAVNLDLDRIWRKLQELGVMDWILGNRIDDLKNYVDDKDDELRAYLLEEIRKQGVALDQLEDYYNYLMQRLAEIAVNGGWEASFVVSADGSTQQDINDFGGAKWRNKAGGYALGATVKLENGDTVKSTIDGNTNDPNVNVAGWVKENLASQIFDESGLSQQQWNNGVESISELLTIPNPKNGSRVYVKSYRAGLNRGGKAYVFDSTKSAINDGGLVINGWVAEYKDRYTIEDFGGVCDFNLDTNTGHDNADAIEKSLAALDYALFTGNSGTSKPVILKSGQSLLRTNADDYVAKTTNAIGVGSNLAPNRSGVSDSYAVDAGIILKHEDNQYTTDVNIEIDIIHTSLSPNSIGIYAPRFYFCKFTNKVFRFGISVKTFDGFKSSVAVQAVATRTGFKWESDGSGNMTGTTVDFSDSWVAFDDRYQTPETGFDLYQLWYSTATNLAVDNGTNGITAYKFSNCKSLEFTGGAENNKGCLIDCLNSSITFNGFKTAAHTGDNDSSNATIKAVSSTLNMNNSDFGVTVGASGMKDIICSGSGISFSNLQSKPHGAGGEVISNNGSISEQSGTAYKIKIGDGVFQIRDSVTQKKNIPLTGYNGIFKVVQSTPLFLRLSITVSSASGSMHKEIDILYLNSTTRDVKIVSTSTVGTIADFSLDFDNNGNVFLVSSGATSARFSIDCKDTYIQGESNNFIDIY